MSVGLSIIGYAVFAGFLWPVLAKTIIRVHRAEWPGVRRLHDHEPSIYLLLTALWAISTWFAYAWRHPDKWDDPAPYIAMLGGFGVIATHVRQLISPKAWVSFLPASGTAPGYADPVDAREIALQHGENLVRVRVINLGPSEWNSPNMTLRFPAWVRPSGRDVSHVGQYAGKPPTIQPHDNVAQWSSTRRFSAYSTTVVLTLYVDADVKLAPTTGPDSIEVEIDSAGYMGCVKHKLRVRPSDS